MDTYTQPYHVSSVTSLVSAGASWSSLLADMEAQCTVRAFIPLKRAGHCIVSLDLGANDPVSQPPSQQ
jgi:hypothetical protein|eukprot:COSAG06_NODE_6837_length_2752_cov_2.036562_2_plen_68_part_00